MKKYLTLVLIMIMCISLAACGSSAIDTDDTDYSGTWVREEWTNEITGVTFNMTLYLYEDNTYKREVHSSKDGYLEYHGEWVVDGDEIRCYDKKLVAGEDPIIYGENGLPKEGVDPGYQKMLIVDKLTLKNGELTWNKQL